ncbi:MAG: hypothetical protein A2X31_07800 [Elusimicrobia bacterium GWB2_63_22]|nr:MAG: hypothetical protein A2X31_07800 [Elusimicrobia bacterium GWB2_63_22]
MAEVLEQPLLPAERTAAWLIAAAMAVVLIPSTILHHFFPALMKVPSLAGVPYSTPGWAFALDLIPLAAGAVCFWHARVTLGWYKAMMFLGGSFFFTGLAENVWIYLGKNPQLLAAMSGEFSSVPGTYYFTRGFFWWGDMPATICLAWFFIAYACVYIQDVLLPRCGIWTRAALGGLLALSLDLWLDPVQVSPAWQSWRWVTNESLKVFSIPLTNFAAWFLLIFLFAVAFEKLPRLTARRGVAGGTALFFLLLLGFKAAILASFVAYGIPAMKYISPPVNLTLWGL